MSALVWNKGCGYKGMTYMPPLMATRPGMFSRREKSRRLRVKRDDHCGCDYGITYGGLTSDIQEPQ